MTEFLVGLAVGALAMLPSLLMLRTQLSEKQIDYDACATSNQRLMEETHSLTLQLAAPTSVERAGIAALLNRPEPEPEIAGRWIHSDDGLVSSFVPDAL